jgi:hypothetical protein
MVDFESCVKYFANLMENKGIKMALFIIVATCVLCMFVM